MYSSSDNRLHGRPEETLAAHVDGFGGQFVDVPGFEVTGLSLKEHVENYETDFGLQDDNGRQFSRLIIEIDLKRESGRIVVAVKRVQRVADVSVRGERQALGRRMM
ncbi:MAG: hypothetical protein ACWGNB_07485 [Thiogranum sp.]